MFGPSDLVTKIVAGGLAAALLASLTWGMINTVKLHNRTGERDKAVAAYQLETAKNAIQRQSIDLLTSQIGQQNAAIDKMNADSDARMKAGADALAAAKQGRSATEKAVSALQASAGRNIAADAPCVSSDAFKAVGKDL